MNYKPMIPHIKEYPDWHTPVAVRNDRVFGILTICKHCLNKVAPQSKWPSRLCALLKEYPEIPRDRMGFPANWTSCPIWKEKGNGG